MTEPEAEQRVGCLAAVREDAQVGVERAKGVLVPPLDVRELRDPIPRLGHLRMAREDLEETRERALRLGESAIAE